MKESKYNIYVEYKDQYLVFNSRTIATAALDKEAIDILEAVRRGESIEQSDLAKQMKRVGFLVDDEADELQQLEMKYNWGKYQPSGLGLVIAPTMACNFVCPYCFEGMQTGILSEELQEKILSMVSVFAKDGQNVDITWFGGEPLLAKDIIYCMSERMMEICQKEQVCYEAGIVTNGYLLDEETILKLKKYKVTSMQITLDGLHDTHNKKRRLKNGSGEPTFTKIIENAVRAKEHEFEMAIRVNVDKETEKELEPLLDFAIEKGLSENLYLGHVIANTDSSKSFCDNCLSTEEFARTAVKFEKLLFKANLPTDYPVPTRTKCGADYLYSYVIDADGDVYKCWNDIGIKKNSIGSLKNAESIDVFMENPNFNYTKYMTWSPFNYDKCRQCKLLPFCMGGCPYNGIGIGEPICENWKYELEEYIKLKCDAVD
ncbi:radical SAM protein [Emergencia sp.]|uniref:radical SAM protein n=1 Tax=Emergencia sp. TaxID=1926557 RepID=UPI003AF04011